MESKDHILVALDTNDIGKLNKLASTLGPYVGGFKIGLEALLSIGLKPALNAVKGYGAAGDNIFVDAKIHDIPNTMAGAVRAVVEHPQVKFVNVHASAGVDGLHAAAAVKMNAKLLAVTVLTSLDADAASEIYGYRGELGVSGLVLKFARVVMTTGCDGVVCSAQEARLVKELSNGRLITVVPGVRPKWADANDQKRVMTPGEAVYRGADYVVIGRPITNPPEKIGSPVAAAKLIAADIAGYTD